MSKRFRDTGIWKHEWYRKLTPEQKCGWSYLCDECDNVGVICIDRQAADFMIGAPIDWEALLTATNGNIKILPNGKWFLVDFCDFQYGELKEECKPHASYLSLLRKHGLEGHPKGIHTLKEKDKEKELEKDKEKDTFAEGVRMKKDEYLALCSQYTKPTVDLAIQKVSAQQIKTGKRYKSPRGAILQWGIRSALEEIKKSGAPKAREDDYCPECHIAGGNHGAFCSRQNARR